MVNIDSVNYGALYSFEPDFLRQINDDAPAHEDPDGVPEELDRIDTIWSGILVLLVLMLMIGLVGSLTRSASVDAISRLSGSGMSYVTNHSSHATRR